MSPDPLKAGPTPVLPYSIPTLCNQEAMKPKLRKRGAMSLITLPKEFPGTPSALPQNQSVALCLTYLAFIPQGLKAQRFYL